MTNSITDVFTAIQNGVTALNNLGKQFNGSLLNVSGQLSTLTTTKVKRVIPQVFTGSGTYTPTSGMLYCIVECLAGGGGGGGAQNSGGTVQHGAGGGGAGGYAKSIFLSSAIGASQVVTVGAAGTGGSGAGGDGTTGGTTSLGTLCTANGGTGTNNGTAASGGLWGYPGPGGTGGTSNWISVSGDFGGIGSHSGDTSHMAPSGAGGSSIYGAGGQPQAGWFNSVNGNNAGSGFGAGGGGAANGNNVGGSVGGNGSGGVLTIIEFCN